MLTPKPLQRSGTPQQLRRQFGPRMSVCIAAFSHPDRTIVAVSDRMLTMAGRTAENAAFKHFWIHGDWFAMMGGDLAVGSPILQDASESLDGESVYDATDVAQVVQGAWSRARVRAAEAGALSAYGLTMDQFLNLPSRSQFSKSEYSRVAANIESVELDCDFLIGGFGKHGEPQIGSVQEGYAFDFNTTGYWAIGSGAHLALGSLASREHNFGTGTLPALYHLLEARFIAEADANVGKDETLALVIRHRQGTEDYSWRCDSGEQAEVAGTCAAIPRRGSESPYAVALTGSLRSAISSSSSHT